ncbi:MAG: DUF1446 domain-containing protein [Candidatus Marinimicrobia bacterium]|jgi:hypothetical protein|nr:DUF1446 domain-containing protein [Candidatus Neomarinimicrobiota bacterium]
MLEKKKIRIGCASGFWGDTSTAAKQLVDDDNIDYLVFDFLAEVTMSILAGAKLKNPNLGYATDFVTQLTPLLKDIHTKSIKIISNAGGINPESCRSILVEEAKKIGVDLKIAIVFGDDLIKNLDELKKLDLKEIDTKEPLPENILSINAYLGAPGIAAALKEGADIVITGRCVDSAMVLGPLIHEFNWKHDDYDCLANGSLAGHIIECGAQCTGGNFTDWEEIKGFDNIGFPIVEVEPNGEFTVSKPPRTGGLVSFGTVAEQFLYEIGDPSRYLLPDVICDFSEVTITEMGNDIVQVKNAKGLPPSNKYKISATYMNGYNVIGKLVIGGLKAEKKGKIIAEAIFNKTSRMLTENNFTPFSEIKFDLIGTNSIYGPKNVDKNSKEVVLRIMVKHVEKEALILFSKEIAQAVTGMTAGVMNYMGGRPKVSRSIHLRSFLLDKSLLSIGIDINNKKSFLPIQKPTNKTEINKTEIKMHSTVKSLHLDSSVPLMKIAYARSGDKGDHANIGIIARKPEYLPFIKNALTSTTLSDFFKHVLKGNIEVWDVPGISGINFLLKHSLGGGGMASFNIDPQGKAYAQQILEYQIPITRHLANELN